MSMNTNSPRSWRNWVVEYNTFASPSNITGTLPTTTSNIVIRGNYGAKGFVGTCAPGTTWGSPASCPATDIDGDARPNPAGTNCDAGADELP